jgi:tRNA dimethylallyltransferase
MRLYFSQKLVIDKDNKIIVIVGPTAVGKTAFAIQLAKQLTTQIISADSRQCYTELNIGVAKPQSDELKAIAHYFINTHSIQEDVNAGVFEQYALQAVNTIFRQSKIAIMVGGTGLYIKAFCEGMDQMPKVEDSIRKEMAAAYKFGGIQWLQNEIQRKDPAFWEVAEQQNPHRLMRALEIIQQTGKSILSFRRNIKIERPFKVIKIGLELPNEELYQRINTRVDQMMEAGLLDEVRSLMPFRSLNALNTVGYNELFKHLDGNCSLEEAIQQIKINSRHYAKRQMTWFKKDTSVRWYPATGLQTVEWLKDILNEEK